MSAIQNQPQIIYLIERAPPHQKSENTVLDKIKRFVGTILAFLGLAILVGATFALTGYAAGTLVIDAYAVQSLFMTGIAGSIAGFHLAKEGTVPSTDFNAGPFTISI